MQVYRRIQDGTEAIVTRSEGLREINHAMLAGRREVKAMWSISRTDYEIQYKDGRTVRLTLTDETPAQTADDEDTWTVASHRTLLHRFTEATKDGRAVCNKSFRPREYGNGYDFKSLKNHLTGTYGHLYKTCPRCAAK